MKHEGSRALRGEGSEQPRALDEYLASDAQCDAWHGGVGATHGIDPGKVKRWPNILGNGGTYKTSLEDAGLALDSPRDQCVERMETELHALRRSIMQVSREKPDALWPGSALFVEVDRAVNDATEQAMSS